MDIILSWKAWGSMTFSQILRYVLKFAVAAIWVVILPIGYSHYVQNPAGIVKFLTSWAQSWTIPSLYNYAIAIFMAPNILAAVVFFFPPVRKYMERSNSRIITLILWWSQASMFPLPITKVFFLAKCLHSRIFAAVQLTFM